MSWTLSVIHQITLCCAIGFTLFGYDQGLYSGIVVNAEFLRDFNDPDSTLIAHISATFDVGCLMGAVLICWMGEKIGRRKTMMSGCIVHAVGGVLQASSYSPAQMIVGRFVAGFGNGFITATVPIWQSETASAERRGKYLCVQLAIVDFGIVIVNWINFGMRNVASSVAWRFPIALQSAFALTCCFFVIFLPESPRWLITNDKLEEGEKAIARILQLPVDHEDVQSMKTDVLVHVEHEKEVKNAMTLKQAFSGQDSLQNARRLFSGAWANAMQQLSGINVILYYLPYILKNAANMDNTMVLILNACNSMNLAFFTLLGWFVIDRVGRKKLMSIGFFFEGVCFALVTVGLAVNTRESQFVSVAFMFFYNTVFSVTTNATPYLYAAEVNSQYFRSLGGALGSVGNWTFNYIVVLITPIGITNIEWRLYIIFAVLNFVFCPIVWFFYVETAGLTLEQVDELFERLYYKKKGIPNPVLPVEQSKAIREVKGEDITIAQAEDIEGSQEKV